MVWGRVSNALLSLEPDHIKESPKAAPSIEDAPSQRELPCHVDHFQTKEWNISTFANTPTTVNYADFYSYKK